MTYISTDDAIFPPLSPPFTVFQVALATDCLGFILLRIIAFNWRLSNAEEPVSVAVSQVVIRAGWEG